ncbi:MAG: hypothetical protein ABSG31_05815, partial [Tepidisphaeraceae bacterium]
MSRTDWARWTAPLLVMLVVAIAYSDSFSGPFIYDDLDAIANDAQVNPQIQSLFTPPTETTPTTLSGRPVLRFSFALDYAVGGLDVRIYHATNFAIHLACSLLVYGIIRRILLRPEIWGERFMKSAPWLAAAVAGLWGVHPLNTQAVTYIVQRAESLASMFYLLTLYCSVRAAGSEKSVPWWGVGAIASAILGMGCKEILATVPVVAALFDSIFLAGSWKAAMRKRWGIYAGLLVCWLLLLIQVKSGSRGSTVSFHEAISAMQYALTQLGAIASYLRLMVWPTGLVLDEEGWPIAHGIDDVGIGGAAVVLLLITTIFMLWRWPKVGFSGAWFFLLLAPSSSFVPIVTEVVAEHRMYLPMLGWIALAVIGGWSLARKSMPLHFVETGIYLALLAAFCTLTIQRNAQYHTAEGIWRDTIAKRPTNPRAHFNLGYSLMHE